MKGTIHSVLGACLALSVALSACTSSGGADAASAEPDVDLVQQAAEICNVTLKLASEDQDFAAMLQRDKENAAAAAKLAVEDEKYAGLAKALSDISAVWQEANQYVERGDFESLQLSQSAVSEAKRDVLSECQMVKASGGDVSDSGLDSYIR